MGTRALKQYRRPSCYATCRPMESGIALSQSLSIICPSIRLAPDPGKCGHSPTGPAQLVSSPCWTGPSHAPLSQTRWSRGAGLHLQASWTCPGAQP
eukprot:scaffold45959_cov16-Tisochrysis_lutea.AAC.1